MAMGGAHMEDEYFWALWEVVFKGRHPVPVAEAWRTMDLILIMKIQKNHRNLVLDGTMDAI